MLASEKIWVQTWVQLDTPGAERLVCRLILDAYALEQRKMGRFGRPLNNWTAGDSGRVDGVREYGETGRRRRPC